MRVAGLCAIGTLMALVLIPVAPSPQAQPQPQCVGGVQAANDKIAQFHTMDLAVADAENPLMRAIRDAGDQATINALCPKFIPMAQARIGFMQQLIAVKENAEMCYGPSQVKDFDTTDGERAVIKLSQLTMDACKESMK